MASFFEWFRLFRRIGLPPPRNDPAAYHARRFVQERDAARQARSAAARDAHRGLAAAHRVAMERDDDTPDERRPGDGRYATGEGSAPFVP